MLMNNKIIYLQAGGPTSVINASFVGLYEEAMNNHDQIFVSPYGLSSLINNSIIKVKNIDTNKLLHRPGSFFGSARIHLNTDSKEALQVIDTLRLHDIHQIFVNGGNDSMDTALKLSKIADDNHYPLQVIGIPKTIDNDLKETDHTPGYASACKYIINATSSVIIDDLTYAKGRVNIIEVMGRDSGYLALSASLVNSIGLHVDLTYIPEIPFNKEEFVNQVAEIYNTKRRCTIIVSEGIKNPNGQLLASMGEKDAFGNIQMGGVANNLANFLSNNGYRTRGIELNVLQRAAFFLTSPIDVKESYQAGKHAYLFAKKNLTNVMVAFKRISSSPYRIQYIPVSLTKVATLPSSLNLSFLNKAKTGPNKKFIEYLTPLLGKNYLDIL